MDELERYCKIDVLRVKYMAPLRAYFKTKGDTELQFNKLKETYDEVISILSTEDCCILFNCDDLIVLQVIERILEHKYEPKRAEIEYYQTLKMMNTAYMLDVLPFQITHMNGRVTDHREPICYMDQNVFTRYIKDLDIGFEVPKGFIIPYSPAHIEEISESKRLDLQEMDIARIEEKTNNLEIIFNDEGDYTIYEERPLYCYKRAKDGTKDIELAKKAKLIDDRLFYLRFGNLSTEKWRQIYNSQNPDNFIINNKELVNDVLLKMNVSYKLEDIKEKGNCNDYSVINRLIHDLYSVMDICGFKKDNDERKVRSSRIDIEHLLYGSVAKIFLTYDEKLRYRARNIYTAMGKQISCPDIKKPK